MQVEQQKNSLRDLANVKEFLERVRAEFAAKPFRPHSAFTRGHSQTLAAYAWPRRYRFGGPPQDEERMFEIDRDVKVLANCRWQSEREKHATIVIWHGMEGSITSIYMIATADKAFRAGFNVVRVNFRNCGGTEHLTPTLYHGGLSDDLGVVVKQLIENDRLQRLYLLGFSLGGNMVLKLAGECGAKLPPEVIAVCALSPSVDLHASSVEIHRRANWIYHWTFIQSLKTRIRLKHKLYPELYDLTRLPTIRTVREFDEEFVARANGFADADDYYHRASSIRVATGIRLPTLIIHAEDDPFIPFAPLRDPAFSNNPYILLIATPRGGHVAFVSRGTPGEDRFWAENRAVEFFQMAESAT
ncbi:MAG TPA: alpha/beta fold hydrolase [Pyrinomonadaceae bacterium]|nr:alpha/beta fold hydrolase [Pyrinomonadaceae bacterium]